MVNLVFNLTKSIITMEKPVTKEIEKQLRNFVNSNVNATTIVDCGL